MHFLIWNVTPAESSWGLLKCLKMQVKWQYEISEEFKKAEESPEVHDENELPGENNRHSMVFTHHLFLNGIY